jgi:serine/threonine protein kinase
LATHGTPIDPGAETRQRASSGETPHLKLGRYEVVRELGKGAMGIVYLAKDPLIGRLVALKTIRPAAHVDDDETKEFQQRFLREAQAAGILNHPSIVTVHDIGQDDTSGVMFIAMEYVEGQNMKEVLSQGRPLTFEQVAEIIAQVGDALDFAHSKGIVHRDVKPANIILLEGMRAKITDFGIAKIASSVSNLTSTGQFLGTPNYMAPEQIKGAPVDGRTDIFSLGICLYECLTRRKPFGGDSLTAISYKIVHEPFPPLLEVNPQIPDAYEDVVGRCLQKDPAKRYQRARDLALALRAVGRGERPVHVEPPAAEETVITRNHDKIPTVEIPFPEAAAELGTKPSAPAVAKVPPAPKKPVAPRPPVAETLKNTLTNVRALPLWRQHIPAAIFGGIIALFVIGLLITVAAIRSKHVPPGVIDTKAETQWKREKQLRLQANDALRQGRLTDAYTKYQELAKVAPHSSAVTLILQQLGSIRQREELSRQQLALAKQKFDEGLALYNQKKYAEAIPLLQESFSINPNSDETAQYLKLAQQDQQSAAEEKAAAAARRQTMRVASSTTAAPPAHQPINTTSVPHPIAGGDGGHAVNNAPVQFSTYFKSPFTDGTLVVKVGSQEVVREPIWELTRFFKRKGTRTVNVTAQIAPVNADIFVSIEGEGLKETKVIPRVNLQPGSAHRLVITADPATKKFDYSIN